MGRKIILSLAMSLDGYIADPDGNYAWIKGDGHSNLNTHDKWDYEKFLENIDVVVMGRNCFDQKMHEDFRKKTVYVATSKDMTDFDNIHFVKEPVHRILTEERQKDGKDIFLFGGGLLVDGFLQSDLIDEYIIGIIPTILGKGRPLFLGNNPPIQLKLDTYTIEEGIAILHYSRR